MRSCIVGGLAGAIFLALVAGCVPTSVATRPPVPENLAVPATHRLVLEADAIDMQIYDCKAAPDDPGKFQ